MWTKIMANNRTLKRMNPIVLWLIACLTVFFSFHPKLGAQESILTTASDLSRFVLADSSGSAALWVSGTDWQGVKQAAANLKTDIGRVTGREPEIVDGSAVQHQSLVVVGSVDKSPVIATLAKSGKLDTEVLRGKWESYLIQTVEAPFPGVEEALVIAGSDMRGTIYGIYELSRQIGVSPWYWWADVPVAMHESLYIQNGRWVYDSPKVKYRGIFLNDEAPALSGWAAEKFGGFNHHFYSHVFELILRLKGNFLWPAMWGKAFWDDDPENGRLADEAGIVVGTSHHEPMGRAQAEWHKYGSGAWDYNHNASELKAFWRGGVERNKNWETLVTIGMRGDGDEPMSEESNIALLEKIVKDQRKIIGEVTGRKAEETPQVWALYKEVQDYYDKGMRVPDDVTLLLSDDNWGNLRKLPGIDAPVHPGGDGIYYHFDYVGGPRSYKWLNVTQVQRMWEQMNLAWVHRADRIWILNVGDLKPMEYPISFFLDMAWNPEQFHSKNLIEHTERWCAQQFGEPYAKEAARIIDLYTQYNHRVTPELLDANTFSLENYNEFERVRNDYRDLTLDAMRLYNLMPTEYKDAFDQLVLFPVNASSNLYEMYFAVAKNSQLAARQDSEANHWADVAQQCFDRDSLLTLHYHTTIANGKWNHMMDQIRIGYTNWNEPRQRVMPKVTRIKVLPLNNNHLAFAEADGYVAIEAGNFQSARGTDKIRWEVIPGLGKTVSGVTTWPANQYPAPADSVYLEYAVNFTSTGTFDLAVLLSPTLNFNGNKGLRYAISFDGGPEQVVNMNQKYDMQQFEQWQAERINRTATQHTISRQGVHRLRFRVLEPGIVLQKILIDTGGLKKSYLGAPQSQLIKY